MLSLHDLVMRHCIFGRGSSQSARDTLALPLGWIAYYRLMWESAIQDWRPAWRIACLSLSVCVCCVCVVLRFSLFIVFLQRNFHHLTTLNVYCYYLLPLPCPSFLVPPTKGVRVEFQKWTFECKAGILLQPTSISVPFYCRKGLSGVWRGGGG